MTNAIQALNDKFRKSFTGGQILLSASINAMQSDDIAQILSKVKTFEDFNTSNDPYNEHDFGRISHNEDSIFWKIDYYDTSLKYGSEDPANAIETARVLTIMLAEEY